MRGSFFHTSALVMRLLHTGIILFTLAGAAYQFIDPSWAVVQGPSAAVIILASFACRGKCPLSLWEEQLLRRAGDERPVGEGFLAYYSRRFGMDFPASTWDFAVWCFLFFSLGASAALMTR